VKAWLVRLQQRPIVAHVLRTGRRFTERLGLQFAGAITYFSVLAVVPILMFAFSITGFVLVELHPDLIDSVVSAVAKAIGGIDPATHDRIVALTNQALRSYSAIGVVGLLSAAYAGAGWINNLKKAVRAQTRANFEDPERKKNIAVRTLVNFVTLVGLLLLIVVTLGLGTLASSLADAVFGWLGLSDAGWLSWGVRAVPVLAALGTGWLLFVYLYTTLPSRRMPWPALARGALIGTLCLAALQYATGFLVSIFEGNVAAAIFGPIIALMLFLNLFSMLILLLAAWIATWTSPRAHPADALTARMRDVVTSASGADGRGPVGSDVARRPAEPDRRGGWFTGLGTGIGLGAALAWLGGVRTRRSHRS
jgi:membrane protein